MCKKKIIIWFYILMYLEIYKNNIRLTVLSAGVLFDQ